VVTRKKLATWITVTIAAGFLFVLVINVASRLHMSARPVQVARSSMRIDLDPAVERSPTPCNSGSKHWTVPHARSFGYYRVFQNPYILRKRSMSAIDGNPARGTPSTRSGA
jgi:hypothetical protein